MAIISVVALTCWGIGEMALKTGYKVNNTEIILDDYNKFGPPTGISLDQIKARCNGTLNEYKAGGQGINASRYVEGKGQIPAELPGDNYYKAPGEVQKFALYGTNTVGGWIDGVESNKWEKFEGNTTQTITIKFDGEKLGIALSGDDVSWYIPDDDKYIIRRYVLDDGTSLNLSSIKIWVYAVGSGGSGSQGAGTIPACGGFGGGSYISCLRLNAGDVCHVRIGQKTPNPSNLYGQKGEDTTLTINDKDGNYMSKLTAQGGGAGNYMTPSPGDANYEDKGSRIISFKSYKGGETRYMKISTEGEIMSDYFPIWSGEENIGGHSSGDTPPSSNCTYRGMGGTASGFPYGWGGYIYEDILHGDIIYANPGYGGGGSSPYTLNYITYGGTGGPGALWILYA